ncbi:U32 family peptidase [Thermophilibacter provencensis]|uniref:U32 family peptidase n=1 Tax=Thermophilibacter provencensis TaxID=1852386 RepID=A0ABT7V152_9ACTN|nr:U32 family peptidase [Thermophilibacter provencensis]MDM8270335.1 U32 family peptidase [Thermophilibacter provencensis]
MPRRTTFLEAHGVPELLAPAGGPEPFNAALAAGADAIYCGLGNDFNARRGAKNFDDESFSAACRRAHLAGTRVYVTVNVAISTEEMPRVLELVRRAWGLGADAFIIQDWGLMAEVRRRWPQIETHVSTQANVHDARGVAWCRDVWGVDRVTLSRELSLTEISRIAEEGVELECFGHGALCFCYSGVCLMSSLAGGRSANRGLCAQPCRLPYDLVDEDGRVLEIPGVATQGLPEKNRGVGGTRLLCPKDYCTVDHLADMRDAGVGSLKVEGRMKAPDYVFSVVGAYRDALDALAAGEKDEGSSAALHRRLKRAFNRDFTDDYLWGRSGNKMMSYERSNNRGEVVGEVVGARVLEDAVVRRGGGSGGRERLRRHTRADVEVRLSAPVGAGDLLEIRPIDDPTQFLTAPAPEDAAAGEKITCRAARPMPAGSVVRVIRSQRALDDAARVADKDVVRRRPVHVRVTARLGEPFSVELECADGAASARAEGFVVEAARTRPVDEKDLVEHVGRMGQSPFEPVSFSVELDPGCGMGFSAVHKVRAEACARLEEVLLAPYAARDSKGDSPLLNHFAAAPASTVGEPCVCALVTTPECAEAARAAGASRVYALADDLAEGSWPEGVVPWLDEICREVDHARLDRFVAPGDPVAVGNVSELALAAERGAAPEVRSCIPVHNTSALAALESAGAAGFWLSPELTLEEVCALARAASVPVGLSVLGRERVMTSEHCVLQALGRCVHDCRRCELRRQHLSLRDIDGRELPVRTDVNGRSRIFSASPLDATPQVAELLAAGVTRLMVDAQLMDAPEVGPAVERVVRAVEAAREGRRPAQRLSGHTSGHLFAGIG